MYAVRTWSEKAVILEPKTAKSTPTLSELNARMNANASAVLEQAKANARRITGIIEKLSHDRKEVAEST